MDKFVTVFAFDKHSSETFSVNIVFVKDFNIMKERIKEFFDDVPFLKWYYEIECQDEMDDDEMEIIELIENEF